MAPYVFISHTSANDDFVTRLRSALEGQGVPVWVDSRQLRGGDQLSPEIVSAIRNSRQVLVVVSPLALKSEWVHREVAEALRVQTDRQGAGYRVVPLMLPGVEPSDLRALFGEEPVGIRVESTTVGGLSDALVGIVTALGERLPADRPAARLPVSRPLEELRLQLREARVFTTADERRVSATGVLVHTPADDPGRATTSAPFEFVAPLGAIHAPGTLEDLTWYLEEFHRWPTGVFQQRADRIVALLPQLGRALYDATTGSESARAVIQGWQAAADQAERRFSVEGEAGADGEAGEAACALLALPWELIHDGQSYLFQGRNPVRVRRRLPSAKPTPVSPSRLPIRILLVCPRPDGDGQTLLVDHRVSAAAVVDAVEGLGELVTFTVLTPPTFGALQDVFERAANAGMPFDIVHFDGYGLYDSRTQAGGLAFEDPRDSHKLERRAAQHVTARQFADVMRDYRIALAYLEVWQTARAPVDPIASVATQLLVGGVSAVVAMSRAVITETARRFVAAFYQELAEGRRIGAAMVSGQRALYSDTYRNRVDGAGELRLQDWFVPVLYQHEDDPPLVTQLPRADVDHLLSRARRLSLGALPETPKHGFVGRSHELLTLERLLDDQRWAVIRGRGGAGKTTLGVELARWLARTGRFAKAAFVSLEQYSDARGVLDALGRQLLADGPSWSVALFPDLDSARQPVERALREHPSIVVLDNFEAVLPPPRPDGTPPQSSLHVAAIFDLCSRLLEAEAATRILFTSREALPEPFGDVFHEVVLGSLAEADAIQLVNHVLARNRIIAGPLDPGETEPAMRELVNVVGRHARALVLVAPAIARRGVSATIENLTSILADLDRRRPGDRENSLYASVELSLRRLAPEVREQLRPLAAFHGGAQVSVMAIVLEVDVKTAYQIGETLVEVGLADLGAHLYFRFDSALPYYLRDGMQASNLREAQTRWANGMRDLVAYLYEQMFSAPDVATSLALQDLGNLMALLAWTEDEAGAEQVIELASPMEQLLIKVGQARILADVAAVRERARAALGPWSHAQYLAAGREIGALFDRGELQSATEAAGRLLRRGLDAGEAAYSHAAYDIAMAHLLAGRTLNAVGHSEKALSLVAEASSRFQSLITAGQAEEPRMVAVAIGEMGDCLRNLGRLDDAADAYNQSIEYALTHGDSRQVALSRRELGSVRLLQDRLDEALELYEAALPFFESQGESRELANTWHQIAMVHRKRGEFTLAEEGYKNSLALEVQRRNRTGEAETLLELGSLYAEHGMPDDAVSFYRQGCDVFAEAGDQKREGVGRVQLAAALLQQEHPDEASQALQRAIACLKPLGANQETWEWWDRLHTLQQQLGEPAAEARALATAGYLAYRRGGGASRSRRAALYARVSGAGSAEEKRATEQWLLEQLAVVKHPQARAAIDKLLSILHGQRDPSLADDPQLGFMDVAEVKLLIEGANAVAGQTMDPSR